MKTAIVAAVAAALVAVASSASATIATSPAIFVGGSQTVYCLYTNLETKKEVVASRYLVDAVGDRVYASAVTIPPGSTAGGMHSAIGPLRCGLDGKFRRRRIVITACALSGGVGGVTEACVSTSP